MSRRGGAPLAGALLVAAGICVSAQSAPEVRVRILSPGPGSFLSGPVLLRAAIEPPVRTPLVARVTFFADGRLVCHVPRPPFECAWDAGVRMGARHVRAVATLRDGRRTVDNVHTQGIDFAEHVDVDAVQVTVSVTDRRGRFVNGLAPVDFRVFEDEVPQRISHFASEDIPLEVVAALDISGSMTEAIPALRHAARQFLRALSPDDQVTLLAFNDNLFTLARRQADPAARLRALDRLSAWGGTALYDAIIRSLDMLGRQQGRRVLVVFTDGEDQHSHATLETVERRVEASDATIYMVAQGRGTRHPELQQLLEQVSRVSGGRAFLTDRIEDLEGTFREVLDELSNQYLLSYLPDNQRRDGAWRSIRVDVAGEGYRVRARQGYRVEQDRH